jgi:hypothetical protein
MHFLEAKYIEKLCLNFATLFSTIGFLFVSVKMTTPKLKNQIRYLYQIDLWHMLLNGSNTYFNMLATIKHYNYSWWKLTIYIKMWSLQNVVINGFTWWLVYHHSNLSLMMYLSCSVNNRDYHITWTHATLTSSKHNSHRHIKYHVIISNTTVQYHGYK